MDKLAENVQSTEDKQVTGFGEPVAEIKTPVRHEDLFGEPQDIDDYMDFLQKPEAPAEPSTEIPLSQPKTVFKTSRQER